MKVVGPSFIEGFFPKKIFTENIYNETIKQT